MDYERREKSLGSVHSMLQLDEPCLTQRTASALTVLTAAAIEGTALIRNTILTIHCQNKGVVLDLILVK